MDAVIRDRENALPRADARHARDAGSDHDPQIGRARPYGVYDREFERLHGVSGRLDRARRAGHARAARSCASPRSRSPGADAYETAHRCERKSRVFEKRAACIEAEGWERLEAPPR
jgi:hypothetical protein